MLTLRVLITSLLAFGCGDAGGSVPIGFDAGPADGGTPPTPSHLLITEVSTQILAEEFVELYNPTAVSVSLDDYYLSDDSQYALLPGMTGAGPAPTIGNADFIVRFPAGSAVAPGQVVVVARDGDSFATRFGAAADFSFGGMARVGLMGLVSVGGAAGISDTGEGIALFYWDGVSDLVQDVDLVIAGIPGPAGDQLADKTGIAVDGPDGDTAPTTYRSDVSSMRAFDQVIDNMKSYQRIEIEGPEESTSGGNGLGGHDETSEDLTRSWGTSANFSTPTPGTVPTNIALWPR